MWIASEEATRISLDTEGLFLKTWNRYMMANKFNQQTINANIF